MQSVFIFLLVSILQGNAAPTGSVTSEGLLDSSDLSSTAFSSNQSNCSLSLMPGTNLHTLKESLQENSLLENVKIDIWNYSSDFLDHKLAGFVKPNHWFRVRKTTGMSLLLWENTFWNLLEVHYAQDEYMSDLNIALMDNPSGCLRSLSANDTSLAIRTLILNDFDTENSNKQDDQISANIRVCSKIVKEDKGSASLVYFCCEKKPDGDVTCAEAFPNMWLQIVMQLYFPLFILLFFYSPSVINYLLSLGMYTKYKCKLEIPCLHNVQDPSGEYKKCEFRTKGKNRSNDLQEKEVDFHEVHVYSMTLLIKSQRLLKQNGVPIGFRKLMTSFFSCRFRSLSICKFKKKRKGKKLVDEENGGDTADECLCGQKKDRNTKKKWLCEEEILPPVKLYQCLQAPTKIFIALLFSVPFIIMCLNLSSGEDWKEIERVEKQLNLTLATKRAAHLPMIIVYGMCLSIFYAFAIVDLLSLGWLWKRTRPTFYKTFQSTVKCNEKIAVNGIRKWLTCPFQSGYFTKALKKTRILWYIPYICLTSIWIIICWLRETPLALFLYHTKHASFESSEMCNCQNPNPNQNQNQNPKSKSKSLIKWNAVLMGVLMLIIFFGLAHWILFVIYMFFFAIVGLIIYVEPVMNILIGLVILFNYGRTTFHKVQHDYLQYYRRIFEILMEWKGYDKVLEKQEKIQKRLKSRKSPNKKCPCGRKSSSDQESGEDEINYIVPVSPSDIPDSLPRKLSVDKQKPPLLTIKHMFLLVDENGDVFMPVKFFWKSTKIDSCLAPGAVDKRYFAAFVSFLKIVIFLVIVLIVVIAFGDMYRISLTNQLLVTMAASFVPRLFELINSNNTTIDKQDVAFGKKLLEIVAKYKEGFPVYDLCYKDRNPPQ